MDQFTVVLIVMVVFVVMLIAGAGRSKHDSEERPLLPRIVAAGAMVGIVLVAASTIVIAVGAIVSDTVTLNVPLIAMFELPNADQHTGSTTIMSGTTADITTTVTVSGASASARTWLIGAHIVNAGVAITVLAVIAQFARQTAQPQPFTTSLRRALVTAGAALAVGLTASQILFGIAGSLVRGDIYAIHPPEGVDATTTFALVGLELSLLPVGVGLTVIVAASLIRSGERLQRDTEGLV